MYKHRNNDAFTLIPTGKIRLQSRQNHLPRNVLLLFGLTPKQNIQFCLFAFVLLACNGMTYAQIFKPVRLQTNLDFSSLNLSYSFNFCSS